MGDVVVKCAPPLAHMRGGKIAGMKGRLYLVHATTLKLYLLDGDDPAAEAGVHPDDAARFLSIPFSYLEVKSSSPPKPRKAEAVTKTAPIVADDPIVADIEAPEVSDTEIDFSILDGSVSRLRRRLESGDYDDVLFELLQAEEAGKTRKSAVEALHERINF